MGGSFLLPLLSWAQGCRVGKGREIPPLGLVVESLSSTALPQVPWMKRHILHASRGALKCRSL